MFNDKTKPNNSTTPIDPKKVDPSKKDGEWADPKKDGTKTDPKKDETIKH